jgi:hypothetical protein|tara:strand:- start:48 stop:458 length:411 start_codon:yes stop_codon:yes gene_type:complete
MKFFTQAHFIIGIAFFLLFLLTGAYMILNFPELYNGREEVRMMYRATHIYILMSALINLMAGNYLLQATQFSFLILRKLASLLILVTPILFFIAFIYEPARYLIERPVSFWAVVFLVAGVILHSFLNIKWLNKSAI